MNILTFSNRQVWQDAVLQFLQDIFASNQESFSIGLSGGSAAQVYTQFGELDIDWKKVNFYLCDERYVPLNDEDSNCRLLKENIASDILKQADVYCWDTDLEWQTCAEDYARKLPEVLDVAILGIGPDGHFASIFPNNPLNPPSQGDFFSIWQNSDKTAVTTTDQFAVQQRLTITPQYLAKAKHILVLLQGSGKAGIVQELQHPTQEREQFPAHWLYEQKNCTIMWLNT
jgi:6-phosphogluconolactonase